MSHAYDSVYEGFWDLYCRKSPAPDLNPKKLEGFFQRVKLSVPPQDVYDDDQNLVSASPVNLPLKAIVRIRIPLKRPVVNDTTSQQNQPDGDNEGDGKLFLFNIVTL